VDSRLRPQGRGEGREGEGKEGEEREVSSSADGPMSARTHGRVRADASVLPPWNFIMDATVRPSHGRPTGHRPSVRLLSSA
jgi:hypothetical protein